ncbi:MAG: hypothetical protein ABI190_10160 [Casimicrobiaceae bacterium]
MASTTVATSDARPFFERALRHGIQSGIISSDRQQKIFADGSKGIVQIANYFGTAHLRAELEIARDRMVTLLSLYLEDLSKGDLRAAAASLQQNSLLSHSKGGSDMLRRLSVLPSVAIIENHRPSADDQRNDLNEWTFAGALDLRTYRTEWASRQAVQREIGLARWVLQRFGVASENDQFGVETRAVFNSAMLVLLVNGAPLQMPTRVDCVRLVDAVKKKRTSQTMGRWNAFLAEVPAAYVQIAKTMRDEFLLDLLPRINDKKQTADSLLYGDHALNLYLRDDLDGDSGEYDRQVSSAWHRITSGDAEDPQVIATVLLRVATGLVPKASLLKREAKDIVSGFRAKGFNSDAVVAFIEAQAPLQSQPDLVRIWKEDIAPESTVAISDNDPQYPDAYMSKAVAYLRRTCRARWTRDDR